MVKMNRDTMKGAKKKKNRLSVVPEKVGHSLVYAKSIGGIKQSLVIAEQVDNHYSHVHLAQRDINLSSKWEGLPIYHDGEHLPKLVLFKNFKRAVNNVL